MPGAAVLLVVMILGFVYQRLRLRTNIVPAPITKPYTQMSQTERSVALSVKEYIKHKMDIAQELITATRKRQAMTSGCRTRP